MPIIALAIVSTSSAAILIRYALDESMPPLLIAGSRLAIATLALTPLALGRHRARIAALSRRELAMVVVSGLCLALHFTAWVSSLQYTTVLVSVVIVSTGPIWVAIMEVAFLRIRLSRLVVLGLLVALAGGALIGIPLDGAGLASDLDATIAGALLAWLGALSISVYMLIGRTLRPPAVRHPVCVAGLWLRERRRRFGHARYRHADPGLPRGGLHDPAGDGACAAAAGAFVAELPSGVLSCRVGSACSRSWSRLAAQSWLCFCSASFRHSSKYWAAG